MKLNIPHKERVRLLSILQETLAVFDFDFSVEEVLSKRRHSDLNYSRACIAYYLRKKGKSATYIGTILNRDHATALNLLKYDQKRHGRHRQFYNDFKSQVDFNTPLDSLKEKISRHEAAIKSLKEDIKQYKKQRK